MTGASRVWERRRGSLRRRDPAGRVHGVETLDQARRIARELSGGLTPEAVGRVVPEIRELLGAGSAALLPHPGQLGRTGEETVDPGVASIVEEAAGAGRARRRGELLAAPVVAAGELRGVLVASGAGLSLRAVDSLAAWLGDALEWGRLESVRDDLERAELRRMRAQISPHFFSNSLSAITSLVRSDPERARELLIQFAQYARYSLSSHGDFVTVAEEFRAIEAYLQLERARFGSRLSTSVCVVPELLPVTVPVLVLQPLVENAVRHGIERRPGPGTVSVTGSVVGADCLISVEDDGIGMEQELAEAVLTGDAQHSGIGLANVDRRLRAVHGNEYGLMLETAPGAGTKVTVRIPRSSPPRPLSPRRAR